MSASSAPSLTLSRGAKALGFFLAAVLLTLLAVGIAVLVRPPALVVTQGQAHIVFSADSNIFQAGDCTIVHWQVDGIREVYLDKEATVGSGEHRVCVSPGYQPTLRVVFHDGSITDYPLTVGIVSRWPILWGLLGLAGLMLFGMAWVLAEPAVKRIVRPLRRPAARLSKLAVRVVAGLLVAAVLLELGVRAYLGLVGTRLERIMYLYSEEDIQNEPSILLALPYVNYIPSPNYTGHNRLGYRGPEVEIPKPAGVYRIVALGGSTTYSSATDAEDSYPAQLQKILREDFGYSNVEVVNAGMSGYTSWDNLANYIFRVVELEPDMLIIYAGYNDVRPRMVAPECYRGLNATRGLNPLRALYREITLGPGSFSALYRLLAIRLGWIANPTTLSNLEEGNIANCPQPILDSARLKDNPPVYFERNMRDIILVAHGSGTEVMLSTWTYNPVDTFESLPAEWRPAIDEHNEIVRRLAAEYHLPFYDLANTDFAMTLGHWAGSDPIHLSASGTHEQARLYATYLVDHHLIPEPR